MNFKKKEYKNQITEILLIDAIYYYSLQYRCCHLLFLETKYEEKKEEKKEEKNEFLCCCCSIMVLI